MKIVLSSLILWSGTAASSSWDERTVSKSMISMPLIPHHVQMERERRRRRRLDRPAQNFTEPVKKALDNIKSDALYQGYGTHYVDLWVGTPPQRQTLIVDTGSSVTAFPCMDCANCGSGFHIDGYFQEEKSETFVDVDCDSCTLGRCNMSPLCELSVSYQEGSSWKAYEVTDMAYTGGPHDHAVEERPADAFRFHFGCQTRLTGLFKTQLADGIMGMEMSDSSFWKQAHTQEAVKNQAFSLCFSRQPTATKEGTSAGIMTLGGTDERLHSTSMVFAEQPNREGWFSIHIKAMFLRAGGGESVLSNNATAPVVKIAANEDQLNIGAVIVDSGTTDTYLSSHLAQPFLAAFEKVTNGKEWDGESPVSLTDQELLAMPTILIQLHGWEGSITDPQAQGWAGTVDPASVNDIIVAVPPTHYMEYSVKTQKYTPRFYFTESRGGVLGANFMMGHEIFFDVDNGRVGFAESNCDYEAVSTDER